MREGRGARFHGLHRGQDMCGLGARGRSLPPRRPKPRHAHPRGGCRAGTALACGSARPITRDTSDPRNEQRAAESYEKAMASSAMPEVRPRPRAFRAAKIIPRPDELRDRDSDLGATPTRRWPRSRRKGIKDAAQLSAREPLLRELDRSRAEWPAWRHGARASAGPLRCAATAVRSGPPSQQALRPRRPRTGRRVPRAARHQAHVEGALPLIGAQTHRSWAHSRALGPIALVVAAAPATASPRGAGRAADPPP